MTVFAKQALIDSVQGGINGLSADLADYEARVEKFKVDAHNRWWTTKRDKLKLVRDLITKNLKDRKVITEEDIKAASGGLRLSELTYAVPSDYVIRNTVKNPTNGHPDEVKKEIVRLEGLLQMLKTVEGPTVSANQLKTLGYTKITELFVTAAKNGGLVQ